MKALVSDQVARNRLVRIILGMLLVGAAAFSGGCGTGIYEEFKDFALGPEVEIDEDYFDFGFGGFGGFGDLFAPDPYFFDPGFPYDPYYDGFDPFFGGYDPFFPPYYVEAPLDPGFDPGFGDDLFGDELVYGDDFFGDDFFGDDGFGGYPPDDYFDDFPPDDYF